MKTILSILILLAMGLVPLRADYLYSKQERTRLIELAVTMEVQAEDHYAKAYTTRHASSMSAQTFVAYHLGRAESLLKSAEALRLEANREKPKPQLPWRRSP